MEMRVNRCVNQRHLDNGSEYFPFPGNLLSSMMLSQEKRSFAEDYKGNPNVGVSTNGTPRNMEHKFPVSEVKSLQIWSVTHWFTPDCSFSRFSAA